MSLLFLLILVIIIVMMSRYQLQCRGKEMGARSRQLVNLIFRGSGPSLQSRYLLYH